MAPARLPVGSVSTDSADVFEADVHVVTDSSAAGAAHAIGYHLRQLEAAGWARTEVTPPLVTPVATADSLPGRAPSVWAWVRRVVLDSRNDGLMLETADGRQVRIAASTLPPFPAGADHRGLDALLRPAALRGGAPGAAAPTASSRGLLASFVQPAGGSAGGQTLPQSITRPPAAPERPSGPAAERRVRVTREWTTVPGGHAVLREMTFFPVPDPRGRATGPRVRMLVLNPRFTPASGAEVLNAR